MLNSSNIKLFAIIALIFFATFESGKSQYLECDIPLPFPCGPWSSQSRPVTVSSYPGCVITANFSYRTCTSGGYQYRQVILDNISVSGNCTQLFTDLLPYGFGGGLNLPIAKKLWKDIYKQLAEDLFLELYNNANAQTKLLLNCPNGSSGVEFQLIDGACQVLCTQGYLGQTQQQNQITLKFLKCKESCCVYMQKFCFNTQTNQVEKVGIGPFEYSDPNSPLCNSITPPINQCTGAYWNDLEEECTNNCDLWED